MIPAFKIIEPEPIVLEGFERDHEQIIRKRIFFVKYDNYLGYLYLESGESLYLTPMRLRIVEQLIEALKKNIPYIAGKDLLYKAGSEQFSVVKLFVKTPNWRKFIEPTKRGFYRLNLYPDATYERYIKPSANDNQQGIFLESWKRSYETQ